MDLQAPFGPENAMPVKEMGAHCSSTLCRCDGDSPTGLQAGSAAGRGDIGQSAFDAVHASNRAFRRNPMVVIFGDP